MAVGDTNTTTTVNTNQTTNSTGNSTDDNTTKKPDFDFIDPNKPGQFLDCNLYVEKAFDKRDRVSSGTLYEYGLYEFCYVDVIIESMDCVDIKETTVDLYGKKVYKTQPCEEMFPRHMVVYSAGKMKHDRPLIENVDGAARNWVSKFSLGLFIFVVFIMQ